VDVGAGFHLACWEGVSVEMRWRGVLIGGAFCLLIRVRRVGVSCFHVKGQLWSCDWVADLVEICSSEWLLIYFLKVCKSITL
jgi:hypothetical protein